MNDDCKLCTFFYYDIEFIYESGLQNRCNDCKLKIIGCDKK